MIFSPKAHLVAALAVLGSGGMAIGASDDAALLEEGRLLFEEAAGDTGCAGCHGENAAGNPDVGAPFIQGISKARLNAALKGAVPDMDYFKLNRKETEAIYAFLQYLGHAEDVILEPDAAAGKTIFEETAGGVGCQSCHGMDAKGDTGPAIHGSDARDILEQLRRNENMKFIKLSKIEIAQVAAYLKYLHELEGH